MAKRIYSESVKAWAIKAGIPATTMVGLIFLYLTFSGAIEITGFSGDQICSGTRLDPCYAYINFTANEDIFIYPVGYDPWGRDTLFEFTPGVKEWKLQRSWGRGWRDIPLNDTCTGTWCGAPNSDGVAYSWVMRKGRDYQVRIVALKKSPYDKIKWAVNYENKEFLDPIWLSPYESTYTKSTETHCKDGICNKIIYSGTRFVNENGEWKKVEDAFSLKNAFDIIYLETEDAFRLEVLDFNYTEIKLRAIFDGNPIDYPDFCNVKSEEEFNCIFKNTIKFLDDENVKQTIKYDLKYEMKNGLIVANDTKFSYKGNPFGKKFKFGGNSTAIILQDADTENIKDTYSSQDMPDTNYGTSAFLYSGGGYSTNIDKQKIGYIEFNLTDIDKKTILNSTLYLYYYGQNGELDSPPGTNYTIQRITQDWNESDVTWNNKPTYQDIYDRVPAIEMQDLAPKWINFSSEGIVQNWTHGIYDNYGFAILTEEPNYGLAYLSSKEYTINISQRPYLNIIYEEPNLCDILFNETSPIEEGLSFRVYSNCDTNFTLRRNGTEILNNSVQSLEHGVYNFSVQRDNSTGYFYSYDEEDFIVSEYFISILEPTTEDPKNISSDEVFQINFYVYGDEGNLTSGVEIDKIFINDTEANIVHIVENIVDEIFYEGFETGWDEVTGYSAPIGNILKIGNFNNADNNGNDYLWASTSGQHYTGSRSFVAGDWDAGTATSTNGIWENFDASTSCDGKECTHINVNWWWKESGLDTGENCWITEQVDGGTPTILGQMFEPTDDWTYKSVNLSSEALSSDNVSVRIMCDMNSYRDVGYIDDLNITGYINIDYYEFGYIDGTGWQINVTAPTLEDGYYDLFINSTAGSHGFAVVNDTQEASIGYSTILDTCTYSSGDWEVTCSDNCTISSPVLMDGSDMIFSGSGSFQVSANITNWGNINLSTGCNIVLDDGVSLVSA